MTKHLQILYIIANCNWWRLKFVTRKMLEPDSSIVRWRKQWICPLGGFHLLVSQKVPKNLSKKALIYFIKQIMTTIFSFHPVKLGTVLSYFCFVRPPTPKTIDLPALACQPRTALCDHAEPKRCKTSRNSQ
jgi:hypothetical protein